MAKNGHFGPKRAQKWPFLTILGQNGPPGAPEGPSGPIWVRFEGFGDRKLLETASFCFAPVRQTCRCVMHEVGRAVGPLLSTDAVGFVIGGLLGGQPWSRQGVWKFFFYPYEEIIKKNFCKTYHSYKLCSRIP